MHTFRSGIDPPEGTDGLMTDTSLEVSSAMFVSAFIVFESDGSKTFTSVVILDTELP